MDWQWPWPILALAGNAIGFSMLSRNPNFKQLFGAKEKQWLVDATWFSAQYLISFLLICNYLLGPQIKDKCKNSLILNVFLTCICLVVPALIEHLAEFPGFHIRVKDIQQHNSQKINELFAACAFALSSWGLSKTYELSFESGFFSVCLEYAMIVSLAIVDKTGNKRDLSYILGTYGFCFSLILLRKCFEKKQGSDTARQRDNQSTQDNTNAAGQNPDNIDRDNQSSSVTSNTNGLQASHTEPTRRLPLDQTIQLSEITPNICNHGSSTSGTWMVRDGSSQRDVRQESLDVNEQNWEHVPPMLYNDTSSNSGDTKYGKNEEEEDVSSATKFVAKEGKDCFAEGISASESNDDHVGNLVVIKAPSQEIGHEERDMRSSTSSGHMEIASGFRSGRYEKDDVPLFPPKSNNIIDDDSTQTVNIGSGQMEKSKYQSEKSETQGYEIDDDPFLPKNSLKVDDKDDDDGDSDHESFDGKGSDDDDDFPRGKRSCKLEVCQKHKDASKGNVRPLKDDISKNLSSEYKNMEVDLEQMKGTVDLREGINHEGTSKPCCNKETSKPNSDDLQDNSSDNEGSDDDDDFPRGKRYCKLEVCQKHKDASKGNVTPPRDDISENLSSEYKNMEVDLEQMKGSVDPQEGINHEGISKAFSNKETSKPNSDDLHDDSSHNEGSNGSGDDFNGGAVCEVGLSQREKNKCLVKECRDITNLLEQEEAERTQEQHDETHGWQTVSYKKRNQKSLKKAQLENSADPSSHASNGGVDVFHSVKQHSQQRCQQILEAQMAAAAAYVSVSRSKWHSDEEDDRDGEVPGGNFENWSGKVKKVKQKKPKKPKKPKVTMAEAASKIDATDLSKFLADVSALYESQADIQLMRFADYFGCAFASVDGAQFPWLKLFRESTVEKLVAVPLSHIPEDIYKISSDWISHISHKAVRSFVLWSIVGILADLAIHQGAAKGSKKASQQVSSKSQVAIFVVLGIVLRRKPDVMINLLPIMKEDQKYQGQDKLPVNVWVIAQASQGDLATGLYLWVSLLLPLLSGKSSINPQSRDLILQLVERILSFPKARTILLNGAVRKGVRVVPPSALDCLLRVTFPLPAARIKATERFVAVYPTLKEVALAGSPGSKAMKQLAQQIFSFAIRAAGEANPDLSREASDIFIWCLIQNPECYNQWDMLYLDNLEASVVVLRKLSNEWKEHSVKHPTLLPLKETLKRLRQKNENALAKADDGANHALLMVANKHCKVILGRASQGHGCLKSMAFVSVVLAVGAVILSQNMDYLDYKKLSEVLNF